jgi:hypothetical protein
MRIDWEERDPERGVITQVLGRSYRDHEETMTHVRGELSEVRMKAALYCRVSAQEQAKSGYSLRQQIETNSSGTVPLPVVLVGSGTGRRSGKLSPATPTSGPSVGIMSSSETLTRTLWLITLYPTGPRKRRHGVGWTSTVRRRCE